MVSVLGMAARCCAPQPRGSQRGFVDNDTPCSDVSSAFRQRQFCSLLWGHQNGSTEAPASWIRVVRQPARLSQVDLKPRQRLPRPPQRVPAGSETWKGGLPRNGGAASGLRLGHATASRNRPPLKSEHIFSSTEPEHLLQMPGNSEVMMIAS